VVARVSRYDFPPERLTHIGEALRAAVRAQRGGYDARVFAAFLGVDRESGRSVAVTVATEKGGLERRYAEPSGAEPHDVVEYEVGEAYVADPDAFEAIGTPRLHLSAGPWRASEQDPLVGAAFALERREPAETLLVAFAEWPDWTQRTGREADVYDIEYFMVRHGSPVA
jgi:hypothetical protein